MYYLQLYCRVKPSQPLPPTQPSHADGGGRDEGDGGGGGGGGGGGEGGEEGGSSVVTSSGETLSAPPVGPAVTAESELHHLAQTEAEAQYHQHQQVELARRGGDLSSHPMFQDVLLQSRLYQGAAFNVGYQNPVFDLEQGEPGNPHQQPGKGRRWSLRRNNSGRFDSVRRVCPAPSPQR